MQALRGAAPSFRAGGARLPRIVLARSRSSTCLAVNMRRGVRAAAQQSGKSNDNGGGSGSGDTSVMGSIFTTVSSDEEDDSFFQKQAQQGADSDKDCVVFINRDGEMVPVLCCDYGFRSGIGRLYQDADGQLPGSGWEIGVANFKKELQSLRRSFRYDEYASISAANPATGLLGKVGYALGGGLIALLSGIDTTLERVGVLKALPPKRAPPPGTPEEVAASSCDDVQDKLKKLQLSNAAVWAREHKREAAGGGVDAPWFVRVVYISLCVFLDVLFDNRPIQRFWFLETVARMPYFSYISVLHLYESLGWWRAGAELRKVHFAEEWNELHHLQIMESLGGDQLWLDRFSAQHAAIVYYWILVALYILAPSLSYKFSELIEAHAVDTYGEFADVNEALLKELPPPIVAAEYYSSPDLYMFDEFQTSEGGASRRPKCNNLYDVFVNIRDDEGEHVKTMRACQDMTVINDLSERKLRGRGL